MPKKKQTIKYPKVEESSSEKKSKKIKKSKSKNKENKTAYNSIKIELDNKEKNKIIIDNIESESFEKNIEINGKNKIVVNKFYTIEKDEKITLETEYEEYKKEDDTIIEIDNILEFEKEIENDIKEDFTKGEEINDKKILGISDMEIKENKVKGEKTLNNFSNPFIKEEYKSKFNEDIEIITEEEKEEKENEEKEKEENEKNALEGNNKLCTIDSQFIEAEGKINLENKKYCYNRLNYAGKNYNLSTKKKSLNKTNLISYYCSLHRTTEFSNEFDKNIKKKKISLCNGKIIYDKNAHTYYLSCDLSNMFNNIISEKYANYKSINLKINNYKNFRKGLIENLN